MDSIRQLAKERGRTRFLLDPLAKYSNIPSLAYRSLEGLLKEGGLPDASDTDEPINRPPDASTYAARLDNGQVVWIQFDRWRSRSTGHKSVYVVNKPSRIKAILAAMTVLESRRKEIKHMKSTLTIIKPSHT